MIGGWSSENKAELFAALIKAQAKIGHALKDSNNPHYKSTFASLESVIDTIKPHFNECDLGFYQFPGSEGRNVWVDTTLFHKSGQYVGFRLNLMAVKEDPQAIGSAISYARRYSLLSAGGIGDKDDDGNAASGKAPQPSPAPQVTYAPYAPTPEPAQKPVTPSGASLDGKPLPNYRKGITQLKKISPKQMGFLIGKAKAKGIGEEKLHVELKKQFELDSLKDLDWAQFQNFLTWVENYTVGIHDEPGATEDYTPPSANVELPPPIDDTDIPF